MIIDNIQHRRGGIVYEFADDAEEWQKDAIRDYAVETFDDVEAALESYDE